jgi:hypothetical protein
MKRKNTIGLSLLALGLLATTTIIPGSIKASDHDDGEVDGKGRNLSLTDLYVFREKDQNPYASDKDLVFVMNTNPRSLPSQQYYFSTNAAYDFHITQVTNKDATPTGVDDVVLRFQFSAPDNLGRQQLSVSTIRNGATTTINKTIGGRPIYTTPLGRATTPTLNRINLGKSNLTVFAGLREDPFFFDVTRFFAVRATLLKNAGFIKLPLPPTTTFRSPQTAVDFAKDYNVNTIVVRVPRSFLQAGTNVTTFDVWETISVKQPNGKFQQFERLGRPAVNEGLIFTNDFLNAFNQIPPTQDLSPAAAPVRAEALKTLKALGNSDSRALSLANAFLPDVMRIDTTGPSGYANALNAKGSPIRGRKLLDDVVDITFSVLTNGAVTTDNVSYNGTPGNPAQGHDPLVSTFPYLALPN